MNNNQEDEDWKTSPETKVLQGITIAFIIFTYILVFLKVTVW